MAKRKRSTEDVSAEIEAIKIRTDHINSKIEEVEKQVDNVNSDEKAVQAMLRNVRRKLTKPALLETKKANLLEWEQLYLDVLQKLRARRQHLRKGLQHLRQKKQLCEKEKQLCKKEKQLLSGMLATPDEDATDMMARLYELKDKVPAPGEVLSFAGSGLLLDPEQDHVYIRSCYGPLFETMLKDKSTRITITGTPGIGKSYFLYYLLVRLLALEKPPPFILWEHSFKQDTMWCYDRATRQVLSGTRKTFADELKERDAWYISDGLVPDVLVKAKIILLSSPRHEPLMRMEKVAAFTMYMPLWDLEELLECRTKVYNDRVPEPLVIKLYELFGGVARYVLGVPSQHSAKDTETRLRMLKQMLLSALESCTPDEVTSSIGALVLRREVSHRVIHIFTKGKKNFELSHLDFASDWVGEAFVVTSLRSNIDKLIKLVAGTWGHVRGHLHEQLMHLLLPQGGVFMVKPIDQKTRDCGNEEVLLLAPASRTRVFQDVAEIEGDGLEGEVYFRPRRTNFKTIDSLLRVDKTLHVFQMTVSTNDKKVSAKALTTLYNDLGVTDKRYERLNLYYVVPPDVFESFKLGVKGTWPPTTTQRHAQRTHLYVLKGSHGQRTAIASPGSQQPTP